MFAVGIDRTTITLDWTMTKLIMHPDELKKVEAEIRSVMGERKRVVNTDLLQLKYMKAMIKETFRLHHPASVLLPRESSEHVIIDGYDIIE